MRGLKNYDGLDPIHVAALKIIEKRGWHVLSVFPLENSTNQEWFRIPPGCYLPTAIRRSFCVVYPRRLRTV